MNIATTDQACRQTDDEIRTDGHWRVTARVTTDTQGLVKSGRIEKYLHSAIEYYAMRLVQARGSAVDDNDQSTARLISNYDGMPIDPARYGSRTPSDTQIDAQYFVSWITKKCPRKFLPEFTARAEEEAGLLTGKPPSRTDVGARFGFKTEKQRSAAGLMHRIDVLDWLDQAIRDFQIEHPPEKDGTRKSLHLRRKLKTAI